MHHVSLTSRLHATSVSSCDIRMANTVVCVYANAQITKSRMLAARALRPDEIDTQSVIVAGGVAGSAYVLTSYPILRIIIYYTPYHHIRSMYYYRRDLGCELFTSTCRLLLLQELYVAGHFSK